MDMDKIDALLSEIAYQSDGRRRAARKVREALEIACDHIGDCAQKSKIGGNRYYIPLK